MDNILGIALAVFASSGFWQVMLYKIQSRDKKKTASERALMYLLRQDLMARTDQWLDKDSMPIGEWTSMVSEKEIYHELGGNGDMKERMDLLSEKHKTAK